MSTLDLYNLNPFAIPQAQAEKIGFFGGIGLGAEEGVQDLSFNLVRDYAQQFTSDPTISEDDWKNSPYWRPKLKYRPDLTWDWAQNMAQRHDDNDEFARLHERTTGLGELGGFIGGMGVGFLDPVNWVALPAGVGVTLLRVTGSRILAAATYGALSNLAVETALTPLRSAAADVYQEKFGASEIAQNLGVSAGLGFLFGGAGNVLGRRLKRKSPETEPVADASPTQPLSTDNAAQAPLVATDGATPTVEPAPSRTADAAANEPLPASTATEAISSAEQPPTPQPSQAVAAEPIDLAAVAKTTNERIKAAADDTAKKQILFDLASTLTREQFVALSKLTRNARMDRLVASKWYREIFDELAGENKASNLLDLDTKVGAIWDKANNQNAIIDPNILLDTVDKEYVRVLPSRDMVPDNVSEDRFVVFDSAPQQGAANFEGTTIALARAKSEILETLGRNKSLDEITFKISDGVEGTVSVKRDKLDEFFNGLLSQSDQAKIAAVLDNETVRRTDAPEQVATSHFDTLAKAWDDIRSLYDTHSAADVSEAADNMVAAVNTADDMREMIDNLRTRISPEDRTLHSLLDEAELAANDLNGQKEALRAAYVCLLG